MSDITDDSRSVVPGSLFVARRGLSVDARRFIPEAIARGAAAVIADGGDGLERVVGGSGSGGGAVPVVVVGDAGVVGAHAAERFYGHPSRGLSVVGVTGTNGKTTVCSMVHQILNSSGVRCGLMGTVVTDDGRSVGESSQTTPGAIELSHTLGTMVESGCRAAAIEVSSHALHQGRTRAIRIAVGVFTNLTGDHLDYHGTMERYADAKAMLFESLDSEALAIVNADDPASRRMVRDCRARVLWTSAVASGGSSVGGAGPGVDRAWVEFVEHGAWGMRVRLGGPWPEMEVELPLFGRHNAMNALQAAAAAHALGVEPSAIERALGTLRPARGRLDPVASAEVSDASGHPLVLVDYAHTDDALRNALAAARPVALSRGGRLVVVFGCGGDRDRTKRPRMGLVASSMADVAIVTSDNPRRERPSEIIAAVLEGVPADRREAVRVHADRRVAIRRAIADADAADVVIIAGKGHEREQILPDGSGGTVKIPFDDAGEARAALAERAASMSGGGGGGGEVGS